MSIKQITSKIKSIFLLSVLVLFSAGHLYGQTVPVNQNPDQIIQVNRILIDDSVKGTTPSIKSGQFSVAFTAKLLSPGNEVGNNDGLGMLFSCGSGWSDGFRAHYNWNTQKATFQIGSAAKHSSIGITSESTVIPGVLHDFVCVFDGKNMRLYIDGKLQGETPYSDAITINKSVLSVGYAGSGVGSNRMYFGNLEFWSGILSESDIAARFARFPAEEKAKLTLFDKYNPVFGAINTNISESDYEQLLAVTDLPDALKESIRNNYWQLLLARKNYVKAAEPILQCAQQLLDTKITENEKPEIKIQRLSLLVALQIGLSKIEQTDKARELLNSINLKFKDELTITKNISAIDEQMSARLKSLEKQAVSQFDSARLIPATVNVLYLSPAGNDSNPGSKNAPVKSLSAAFEKAKQLRISQPNKTVIIQVADGTYYCTSTAVLDGCSQIIVRRLNDSARSVTDSFVSSTGVEFTGSVELKSWESVKSDPVAERFSPSVRDKIYVCDMGKAGITNWGQLARRGYGGSDHVNPWVDLYVNGKPMILAQWPNPDQPELKIGEVIPGPGAVTTGSKPQFNSGTFRFDFDRPNKWDLVQPFNKNDIWATGLWSCEWASNTIKVTDLDLNKKLITVDSKNVRNRFTYHFINVLEELDQPGEYYLDRTTGKLYFYPPTGISGADLGKPDAKITFPIFDGPFIELKNAQSVIIDNIAFSQIRETAVKLDNCKNCYLNRCTISQTGGNGLVISNGSFCGLFNSRLDCLGACGVRLKGGDRATLTPSWHIVHNNQIHNFSRIDRCYAPAVQSNGCGMIITNNLVYDSPHHAFRTDGNDLYIARNEVHSVVYQFSDQAGIDIFCDPTFRGIVIENNLWHHIGSQFSLCGQAGIRLDDSISGVVMKNNIFYRSSGGHFGGIQIHGGRDNLCKGNLFVSCKQAFSFSPWQPDRFKKFIPGSGFDRFVNAPLYLQTYPLLKYILDDNTNRNYIIGNRAINCSEFQSSGEKWDLFVGNRWESINSSPCKDDSTLPSPQQLRKWLESISGKSLKNIGITSGQEHIDHSISPTYLQVK